MKTTLPTIAEMAFKLKLASNPLETDKKIVSKRLKVGKKSNWRRDKNIL